MKFYIVGSEKITHSINMLVIYWPFELIVYQGGLSNGYKNYNAEKELPDETYNEDGIALFRIQGTGPDNMQAIQVEAVCCLMCYFSFHSYYRQHFF